VCSLQPECDASADSGGFVGCQGFDGDPAAQAWSGDVVHHDAAPIGGFEAPAHRDDVVVGYLPGRQYLLADPRAIGHRQVEHFEDDLILLVMILTLVDDGNRPSPEFPGETVTALEQRPGRETEIPARIG
jgi:hypothetical protein